MCCEMRLGTQRTVRHFAATTLEPASVLPVRDLELPSVEKTTPLLRQELAASIPNKSRANKLLDASMRDSGSADTLRRRGALLGVWIPAERAIASCLARAADRGGAAGVEFNEEDSATCG